jgi:hypothetical protein
MSRVYEIAITRHRRSKCRAVFSIIQQGAICAFHGVSVAVPVRGIAGMLEHPTAREGVQTDCQLKTKLSGKRLPLTISALTTPVAVPVEGNAASTHGLVPAGQLVNAIDALNSRAATKPGQRKLNVPMMPSADEHSPVKGSLSSLAPGIETADVA